MGTFFEGGSDDPDPGASAVDPVPIPVESVSMASQGNDGSIPVDPSANRSAF